MLAFAGTAVAVLATFRVTDVAIARLGRLPAASYRESVFLDDVIARWWRLVFSGDRWWLAMVAILMLAAVVVLDRRRLGGAGWRRARALFAGWDALDEPRALRWLIVGVAGVSAWALSCYARNLYVEQLHVVDRLVVLALWLAIAWRPIFVFPFAIAATAVAGQFLVPLGFISWTEMELVLRFPVLFGAFWVVRAVTGRRESDVLIFAWCCLLATTYWNSGLGKLRVGWLTHPHVHFLLLGAYANGWLAHLEPGTVERAALAIAAVAVPLMLFTLIVECGSILMLWRRWSVVLFVALATAFHLGAFAMTGIFFWKWMLVEAMLIAYLLQGRRLTRLRIFAPGLLALSVVAILAHPLWAPSENLTWFDTPLTYSLEFEGIDARGASHVLPAGFFRPYGDAIVMGPAGAPSPHAKLTGPMGVTMDRSLAESLQAVRAPEAVFAAELARGSARTDSASDAFDAFVGAYAANARCARERDPLVLRVIGLPRHLWTFPLDADLRCGVPLTRVRVFERTTFFDGGSLRVIRRVPVRDIAVTSPVSTATR